MIKKSTMLQATIGYFYLNCQQLCLQLTDLVDRCWVFVYI